MVDWGLVDCLWIIVVFLITCLETYSDGTHSLQRIYWWTNNIMLNFSKSVRMDRGAYIFSNFLNYPFKHLKLSFQLYQNKLGSVSVNKACWTISAPPCGVKWALHQYKASFLVSPLDHCKNVYFIVKMWLIHWDLFRWSMFKLKYSCMLCVCGVHIQICVWDHTI